MTVDFADYFWGEKNEGFNSLQQSLKSGPISAKELGEYLRDCAKIQEDHSKAQLKILKTLNGSNTSSLSSLGPLMALFKPFTERVAGMHHEHMSKLGELAKKTFKYAEELSKRQKSLKEETSSTSEVVKSFQDITLQLNKSKELYKQKCIELNKLTRSGEKEKADKAELKFRKAQEDYKNLVTQYCTLRETFEDKLTAYARHCQEMERAHLTQMRDIVTVYFSEVLLHNQQLSQTNEDFTLQLDKLSVNHLLEQFTIHHHTGLEKPVAESCPIEFEEEKVSVASIPGEPVSDLSDRSANSDKLSLNSFNKKEPAASCTNPAASAAQVVISSTSGSGKAISSEQQQLPRLRTWSVARIARKSFESSNGSEAKTQQQHSSSTSSRATSLLNLFLPNNDKHNNNSNSHPSPTSTTATQLLQPNPHLHHHPPNNLCTYAIIGNDDDHNNLRVVSSNRKSSSPGTGATTTYSSSKSFNNGVEVLSAPSTPTDNLDLSRFLQSRGSKCRNNILIT